MKNLFKNLMLVAVAAMAFTACTEENNEVNAVAKKTVVNGVAIIDADDTRSGFVGSETIDNGDGTTTTKYKSAWDGGETLMLFAENGLETTATIDAEGKFSAEFEGELPEKFFMTVCSPAEAWSSAYNYTIPAEQTPRENSVDPAAHILQGQNVYVTNGTADYFSMDHQVAYGKMTVNTPAEFVIDHVDIELNGVWYGSAKNLSYTINADNVVNNTFWFATDVINVTDFTVTAYDADGKAYTKSVTIGDKALNFNYGRVSTFSVSNLEAYEAPAEVYDYTAAYVSKSWGATDKLVTFTADGKVNLNVNFAGRSFDGNAIAAGTYYYGDGVYSNGIIFDNYWGTEGYDKTTVYVLGSVVVSIVDGCYVMEFNKLQDGSGNIVAERLTFKGTIDGLDIPDPRTPLATPNATATVDGKMITISWDEVDGADSYAVTSDFYSDETTGKSVTIEAPEYSKTYYINVKAIASDSNPTYKSSDACQLTVSTDRDPDVPVVVFTSMKFVEQKITYAQYGEYCNVFELTNADNHKMSLYVGSYQSSDTHIAEGSYHYEGIENLGFSNTQWGFQSRVWTPEEYLGMAVYGSSMVVNKSGDIYNISFTLIIDDKTYFYECNAAIGGDDNTGEGGEPTDPENPGEGGGETPDPEPDPENPSEGGTVPEGYIEMSNCIYIGDLMGAGLADEFVLLSADGQNKLFFNINNASTDPDYIKTGEYTIGTVGSTGFKFNMSYLSDTTIINGQYYGNGVADNSGSTLSVVSEGKGGVHEIKLTIKNNQGTNNFYYKGTIN